jgi:hypothetical protein
MPFTVQIPLMIAAIALLLLANRKPAAVKIAVRIEPERPVRRIRVRTR